MKVSKQLIDALFYAALMAFDNGRSSYASNLYAHAETLRTHNLYDIRDPAFRLYREYCNQRGML